MMRPTFNTRVTRLFGIEIPIIQGAMAWLSEAELVSAVSNQGGLGVLGASLMSVEEFEAQVERAKALTDRPFAVNFPLVLADYRAHLEMALRHGVRIVFVSAGSPKHMTPRIKEAGALCVHVAPNLRLALGAEAAGVDAVVLESFEAGGHVSPEGITAITNIPNVAKKLKLPLIAAGGIVDGRGMAAAMCLGADAIQMGTRFLATKECNAHPTYHRLLLGAGELDTPVHSKLYHPGRALRSPIVEKVLELEKDGRPVEEIRTAIGRGRARKAAHEGQLQEGMFYSGAGAGMIDQIVSVKDLLDQVLSEYSETLAHVRGLSGL
jgi:enoyl-[acyl-carrier protein] reductase II